MPDPIEARYREQMRGLARALDELLNSDGERKIGFVLLMAEFGATDGGRVNYISNGNRDDMVTMLREYLARVEGRYVEAGDKKH